MRVGLTWIIIPSTCVFHHQPFLTRFYESKAGYTRVIGRGYGWEGRRPHDRAISGPMECRIESRALLCKDCLRSRWFARFMNWYVCNDGGGNWFGDWVTSFDNWKECRTFARILIFRLDVDDSWLTVSGMCLGSTRTRLGLMQNYASYEFPRKWDFGGVRWRRFDTVSNHTQRRRKEQ